MLGAGRIEKVLSSAVWSESRALSDSDLGVSESQTFRITLDLALRTPSATVIPTSMEGG